MSVLLHIVWLLFWKSAIATAGPLPFAADLSPDADVRIEIDRDNWDGKHLGLKTFWYKGDDAIFQVAAPDFAGRFLRGETAVINHGYSSSNYWYRIAFYNPFETVATIHLHDHHNVYDDFEVYLGTQLIRKLGYNDALHERTVALDLPPQTTSFVYVRKKADALVHQTTFTFWKDYEALRRSIHASELRFQTVVTSLLMSIFLNLSLLVAYRKKAYFYYLGYLVSFAFFASWVWSVYEMPWYSRWGGAVSLFCVAFTSLFVDEFLEIKRYSRRLHGLYLLFAGLSFATMALELVNPVLRAYVGSILSIIIQASTVYLGFSLYFRYRQTHILIFIGAFGSFLISGFVQLMIWMGHIDSAVNTIMFYGVATENVLMLLAIGYRILVTEAAHKQTDSLLLHSFDQLSKVFYPHQILQIREGRKVEETMPVGKKDACILSFQIVGGAALMNENYEEAMENFMVRCRQLLMEHYDPMRFCCDAHIIREMGDGFLCSVGYPFHHIGRLKSDAAVELAARLIRQFEDFVVRLDAPQRIYCSVGIVHGLVKSDFSRSGRIRDDLWGWPVTLAASYGSSSSQLFAALEQKPGNVIILHDAVYESLSLKNRQGFKVLELAEAQRILGKDLNGDLLAYRIQDEGAGQALLPQEAQSRTLAS
jgi:hypothetical protein